MNFVYLTIVICAHMVLCFGSSIEGTIQTPLNPDPDWLANTHVSVDGNKYLGFIKPDGSFFVSDVPSGSYLVEVVNPLYIFQPIRVDINSKGKIRARKSNTLQTNAVKAVTYPLRFSALGKASYFQPREQLRTLDLLLNPTVLLMVLPLLLVMILPKLIDSNDPDFKEIQQMNILNKPNLPDMSDLLSSASFLGGRKSGERNSGMHKLESSPSSDDSHYSQKKAGRKRN